MVKRSNRLRAIKITGDDPKVLCYIPAHKTSRTQKTHKKKLRAKRDKVHDTHAALFDTLRAMWNLIKPLLEPWLAKNPEVRKVVKMLESSGMGFALFKGMMEGAPHHNRK